MKNKTFELIKMKSVIIFFLMIFLLSGCAVKDNTSEDRLNYTDAAELFNKEYDNFITNSCGKVGDLFDYWNNTDFSTLEDIKTYEQMWENVSNDTRSIQNKLMEKKPPEEYEEAWNDITERMGEIVDILAKGKDFDSNHDGSYTGDEMKELLQEIKDEFVSVSREVIELANELESISEKVNISNSKKSVHLCTICHKEAFLVSLSPISGRAEYYCEQHYSKLTNTKNKQEEDNQKSNQNKQEKDNQKNIQDKCLVEDCYNNAEYIVNGFAEKEKYCKKHYDELMEMISSMEEDVGAGSYSQNLCESCKKEGTRSIVGFSGELEYYCTEHYNEIIEILNKMTTP